MPGWSRAPTAEEMTKCMTIVSEAAPDLVGDIPRFVQYSQSWTGLKSSIGSLARDADKYSAQEKDHTSAASLEIQDKLHGQCLKFQDRYNLMVGKLEDFAITSCQEPEADHTAASEAESVTAAERRTSVSDSSSNGL